MRRLWVRFAEEFLEVNNGCHFVDHMGSDLSVVNVCPVYLLQKNQSGMQYQILMMIKI